MTLNNINLVELNERAEGKGGFDETVKLAVLMCRCGAAADFLRDKREQVLLLVLVFLVLLCLYSFS